jgi:uncharacterized membrane protein YoaK (UPF0700 family)
MDDGREEETPNWTPVQRELLLILLAVAGGSLDAAMFLGFGVMMAAQTGNTIILADAIAKGRLIASFDSAMSIVGFIVGAASGELILLARRSRRFPIVLTLSVELVLLAAVIGGWCAAGRNPHWAMNATLIAMGAVAMGMQSAAVLRTHSGPHTTFITGTLTRFTTKLVRTLVKGASTPIPIQKSKTAIMVSRQRPWIYGLTWIVYAIGAICGAILFLHIGPPALFLPMATIIGAIAVRLRSY